MSTPPVPPQPPYPPPPPSPYQPPSSGGGPLPPGVGGPRLPWEERDRLGIVEALVQTVRLLVTDPSDGFSRLRPDGDITSPILFGLILSWVSVLLSQFWQILFGGAIRSILHGIRGFGNVYSSPGVFGIVGLLVIWPVIFIVGLFIGAGIVHLCLMLVGATNDSPNGFEGTLKVYAYSQVAGLASVVPLVGSLVFFVWAIVLEVIGFTLVHRTTQGRALLGVLIPLFVCCACAIFAVAVLGATLAAFFASLAGHGGT